MNVLDALTKVADVATKARAGKLFDAAGKFAKLNKVAQLASDPFARNLVRTAFRTARQRRNAPDMNQFIQPGYAIRQNAPEGQRVGMAEKGTKMKHYKAQRGKKVPGEKFPDLTGDGKVTMADVLTGRGVGKMAKKLGKAKRVKTPSPFGKKKDARKGMKVLRKGGMMMPGGGKMYMKGGGMDKDVMRVANMGMKLPADKRSQVAKMLMREKK
tara:strand:- start:186 stop:824 length:639 start_codon:yes stop_codon:yes gene_type:complete